MTETKAKTFKDKLDQVIFNWLLIEYPNLFNLENPKPLATGIGKVLQAQLPEGMSVADFRVAIGWYCQRKEYFSAVINQQHRYDLNGEIVADISEEDRISAKERSKQIKDKINARRKEIAQQLQPVITEPVPATEPIESQPVKKTLSLKSKKTTTEEVKPMTSKASQATAKGLKVTLVIDPASLPQIDTTGMKKAPLSIFIGNGEITATTEINAKSYRKALSSIEEYGVDGCNVIVQGSMRQYGVIDDAGLVVQPKKVATLSE